MQFTPIERFCKMTKPDKKATERDATQAAPGTIQENKTAAAAPKGVHSSKESLLEGMLEAKPKAKTYGFYIDEDVVAKLDELAKQTGRSKSRIVNAILKDFLFKD